MGRKKTRWIFEKELSLGFYAILLICCWTLIVLGSIVWRLNQITQEKVSLAEEIARSHVEQDLVLREWNIRHGWIYTPVTPTNPPNQLLNLPERDIVTPSGKTLTAVNSASMFRQIYDSAPEKLAYRSRLTSLTPLRPENAPDPWEKQALRQLQQGKDEVGGMFNLNGKLCFRLMRPLRATARCLLCHSQDTFVQGAVVGGISASLLMDSLVGTWEKNRSAILLAHGFLWFLGVVGISVGAQKMHTRIRAKQEVETALRQSELNYRLLVGNIPALVYRGYADGRVDFVDDKVEKLTGYTQEQFSSGQIKWPEIILPEDREECKRILIEALKSDRFYRREYRLRKKDGNILWVAERSQIVCDSLGKIDFVSGVMFDISLQKEMEQSLIESERFWKTLLKAVGVGVVLTDQADGKIAEVNPQALSMLGYKREQLLGQQHLRFFVEDKEQMTPGDNKKARTRRSEGQLITAGGKLIPIWKVSAPLEIGGTLYLLESFVDLTDQRRAELALTRANTKLQAMIVEVRQTNNEINLISQMVEMLQVCSNLEEAFPIVGQFVHRLFPGVSGALYLINSSSNLLTPVSHWGETLAGEQIFSPADCWALRQGKQYLSGTGQSPGFNLKCPHIAGREEGSHFCLPLTGQGETLGLLYLEKVRTDSGKASEGGKDQNLNFSKPQQRLASSLAEQISLSLANLKLRETLRHQAIRDPLTGLFNRRYLQETLDREIHRAQRKNANLGVVMLDIDHFKQFNDLNGHEAGDKLLAVFGRYLKNSIRSEDIACRYGGEEFTLIIPEITSPFLLERAEAIREGTKDLVVHHQGRVLGTITISMGLSFYPEHGNTGEKLLAKADEALYRAKNSGRNRVVMASG